MSASAFLGIALVHLLAAISPGPSFVVAVRTAVGGGFRAAAGLAVGFGLGACFWALAALAGLSVLFDLLPPLFLALKLAGGLFLLWLAISMWRHAPEPMPQPGSASTPGGPSSAVRLGLATQIANPKTAIFFGAIFVGLVPETANGADRGLIILNIFWIETAWYLAVARIFSISRARESYSCVKAAADRCLGTALGALGLKIALG